jgi:hypothetical protein
MWQEIHGSTNWENMLEDNFHPWLRREVIKYGEFAQATYDAFDYDSFSEYCGSSRYNKNKLFDELDLSKNGYNVTSYVYAMSHIDLPTWLEKSNFVERKWSNDSNWMGYVAVSDDEETRRIGRRDVVVAWRGTVAPSEWCEELQRDLEPLGFGGEGKVEKGFLSIYASKSDTTRYNKSSASQQVMKEITKLVNFYKQRGEEVSITITGHSLGGALALLNAYEAAKNLPTDVSISVISFGAPRVGNNDFRDELHQLGVKILRVVVKQDVVPKMPGLVFNEQFDLTIKSMDWVYTHVGTELKLDVRSSPYLKRGFNLVGIHSLETYLHLMDGYVGSEQTGVEFRSEACRDVSLVNKACDMLVDELRIPHCWYQMENKGLVRNSHGRWVKPKRSLEDVPSPTREEHFHMEPLENLTLCNV